MPIIIPSEAGPSSIVDYASLQSAVANWIHRTDLTSTVPDFIQFGENRIYRDLRVRDMETSFTGTISAGVLAVPDRYIELKNAHIVGAPVQGLQRKNPEWIYDKYPTRSSDRSPKFIAREGSSFIFGPYPDQNYTVSGVYYKRLAALATTNTSNWLITEVSDLILFASLCEAAPFMGDDPRIAIWEKKYEQIRQKVQAESDNEEFSGSVLAATAR